MTSRIGEQADALVAAVEILGELELQFAKARFAQDYDCVSVKFLGGEATPDSESTPAESSADQTSDAFVLRNARHPLLERTLKPRGVAVVPLTVEIDGQHRQVIISGPNTGGKDRRAEDDWFDGVDGAIGDSATSRARGVADLRWRVCRHRRLPVDRAEPLHVFGACDQHRFHLAPGDPRFAGVCSTNLAPRPIRKRARPWRSRLLTSSAARAASASFRPTTRP